MKGSKQDLKTKSIFVEESHQHMIQDIVHIMPLENKYQSIFKTLLIVESAWDTNRKWSAGQVVAGAHRVQCLQVWQYHVQAAGLILA